MNQRQAVMDSQTNIQRQVDDRRKQWRREGDKQAVRKTVRKAVAGNHGLSLLFLMPSNMRLHTSTKATQWLQVSGPVTPTSTCRVATVSLSISCLDSKATPPYTESQEATGQVFVYKLHTTGVLCAHHLSWDRYIIEQKCNFSVCQENSSMRIK